MTTTQDERKVDGFDRDADRYEIERLRRALERAREESDRLRRELDRLNAELASAYDESSRIDSAEAASAGQKPPRMWPRPVEVALSTRQLTRRAWRHYRVYGARSVARRIRLADRYGTWGFEQTPENLPEGVVANDPRMIFSCLDSPTAQTSAVASTALTIRGWAWSASGVDKIDYYIDDTLVSTGVPDLERHDVSFALGGRPGALVSGFQTELAVDNLAPGDHRLIVVMRDTHGRCRAFGRDFRILGGDDAYDIYYRASIVAARNENARRSVRPAADIHAWVATQQDDDLEATLESIRAQRGVRWRCTVFVPELSDDWSATRLADTVGRLNDRRVQFSSRPNLADASAATHHIFLAAGEVLGPDALTTLAWAAADGAQIVYSDHDSVDDDGSHRDPVFAPDWSPDHLLARNYVGGIFLVRTGDWTSLSDLRAAAGSEAWRYEFLLRFADPAAGAGANTSDRLVHVPRVLWSRKTAPTTGEGAELERRVVDDYLASRGQAAEVSDVDSPASLDRRPALRRVDWAGPRPKVSIIIPTTGNMAYVRTCVTSILERTTYPNYELLFLDNGRGANREGIAFIESQGIRVVKRDEPFNWARLSNAGARETNGEILLFLNDDIEVVDGEWLTELVRQGNRPGIGAVGAMLLYPDGRIQHAGVFLVDHGGGAMHLFQWQDPAAPLYGDLHRVSREVAANTGACLLVRRDRFEEVGGFDERFEIALNDIDFCLRLMERGYRNLWTPHSRLIHHEKASRHHTEVTSDERLMWRRWEGLLRSGDPFYNQNLTRSYTDCRLDLTALRVG